MKKRPDLIAPEAAGAFEVFQLTASDLPTSHIYMEAQIFTPDSTRLILHEAATAHSPIKGDPRHRYLVCDLEDAGRLRPLTCESGAKAPAVSPDGQYVYYFVHETGASGSRLTLKRVGIDGTDPQTLQVLDAPLPGIGSVPASIYPLGTIRSDGRALALPCFLAGRQGTGFWGLLRFDLDRDNVALILEGECWCNIHPQYCRSTDPSAMHDIMVQENHGSAVGPDGAVKRLIDKQGADIHVISDDGGNFRGLPWGRDGNEMCQGHQCWRGDSTWAITSTFTKNPREDQLIESQALPSREHIGIAMPGGCRNELSRDVPHPRFHHFATDRSGRYFITDTGAEDAGGRIYFAELGRPGIDAASGWICAVNPRSSWKKEAHLHPFLSPDGRMGFFNSDESGTLQAYMIRRIK